MIDYIIDPQTKLLDEKTMIKYESCIFFNQNFFLKRFPFMASEIFCCEIPGVLDQFFNENVFENENESSSNILGMKKISFLIFFKNFHRY